MPVVNDPVHFIQIGADWCSQFNRALITAQVHDAPIILWTDNMPVDMPPLFPVEFRPLEVDDWLRVHPIRLANVKDLFAYRILHEHGGIYLDLDTISLRPAWDLLTDLTVSTEFPKGDEAGRRYNTAVMLGRKGAPVLHALAGAAEVMLRAGVETWGAIGPHLVSDWPYDGEIMGAPYRALNGWSYHSIGDYYANPRDPGEEVRVIHLYSSDHREQFEGDTWTPQT